MNYFGISQYYSPIEALNGWLRRWIWLCYWKQWYRPRRRIANLLKLKTTKRQAVLMGISRKRLLALVKDVSNAYGDDE